MLISFKILFFFFCRRTTFGFVMILQEIVRLTSARLFSVLMWYLSLQNLKNQRQMESSVHFAGVRYLSPYWNVFRTFAKGRWVGRRLVDILSEEFVSFNRYYPVTFFALFS